MKITKHIGRRTAQPQCVKDHASMATAASILNSKWTLMLLYVLSSTETPRRFSDLQQGAGGINPRTLSARLDELEAIGVVTRRCFAEVPPRVEYALTPKGRDFIPIIEKMVEWGRKHPAQKRPE